jgi:hypothetical protein
MVLLCNNLIVVELVLYVVVTKAACQTWDYGTMYIT